MKRKGKQKRGEKNSPHKFKKCGNYHARKKPRKK